MYFDPSFRSTEPLKKAMKFLSECRILASCKSIFFSVIVLLFCNLVHMTHNRLNCVRFLILAFSAGCNIRAVDKKNRSTRNSLFWNIRPLNFAKEHTVHSSTEVLIISYYNRTGWVNYKTSFDKWSKLPFSTACFRPIWYLVLTKINAWSKMASRFLLAWLLENFPNFAKSYFWIN